MRRYFVLYCALCWLGERYFTSKSKLFRILVVARDFVKGVPILCHKALRCYVIAAGYVNIILWGYLIVIERFSAPTRNQTAWPTADYVGVHILYYCY